MPMLWAEETGPARIPPPAAIAAEAGGPRVSQARRRVVRVRKAWCVSIPDASEIIFSPTAKKARSAGINYMMENWGFTFLEASRLVRARRAKDMDKTFPDRSEFATRMPSALLHMVVHAYGGTSPRAGYRNHFCTHVYDREMCRLVFEWGMFTGPHHSDSCCDDLAFFYLTELGRNVAAGEQRLYE